MESGTCKDISSISKELVDLLPQHLHEENGNNDEKVKISEFISIKKEEFEKDDNYLFMETIKKEKDDLGDAFTEDKPSSLSIVKLEPESHAFEYENFSENMNMQNILDSSAVDLNSMLVTCFGDEIHEDQLNKNKSPCDDQKTQERSIKKRLQCSHCDYKSLYSNNLKRHMRRHNNNLEDVNLFKCDHCDYQTIDKSSVNRHILRHKNPQDINIYKCDQCDYQTRYKDHIKKHAIQHENPDDVRMFKCDQCDYQTRYKDYLKTHALRHKNPEDVKKFACDNCDYQSPYKYALKKHALRHINPDHVKMFKCDQCDYESNDKSNLKRHVFQHKNP